ncbi:MAG: Rieske 2Fe-2S domain-containing protein [Thaumarchaeota archaeon]|nr:Rieske 2Fe-2S domain-containing protein [Nitrososphaerota archaeon]
MPDDFVKVAKVSEIADATLKTVSVKDGDVTIANVDGKYYAIGAICKHAEWDLSEGYIESDSIVCAGHGAKWNLQTGEAEFHEPLDPEPLYDVKIVGDDIYLRKRS